MKRYCICVFWEKDGIVRDYFTYYLKGLKKVTDKILVVVNGLLSDESRKLLSDLDTDILVRENKGIDFWAYKAGIEHLGYDTLAQYDELILTNCTCYGPIRPFDEMFNDMKSRYCDFWGITQHPDSDFRVIKNKKSTKVIRHIQSYFIVLKKNLFMSKAFKNYWEQLRQVKNLLEAVGYHEIHFTKYFEDMGFKSDSYIDLKKYEDYTDNPMLISDKLLKEDKLPVVKRKVFFNHKTMLYSMLTEQAQKVLKFLDKETDYNINMIYQDLLATQKMSDLQKSLHFNYILPDKELSQENEFSKTALIMYIYYPDLVEYCYNYALSMPANSDIYLVTSRKDTKEVIEQQFKNFPCNRLEIRLKENRGRDVSAYLVTCKDVFDNYEYICCVHDKKGSETKKIVSFNFMEHCFKSCLNSKAYVNNVLNILKNNPKIGLLTPLPLEFSVYKTIGYGLIDNVENTKALFNKLNLQIPFDYYPIIPYGSMFWIKGNAIKPLFRHHWEYKDFPEEPLKTDGTISHAIERIYSFVAQEAGYFTGLVSPDSYAPIYLDNIIGLYSSSKIHIRNKIGILQKIFSITNEYKKGQKYKRIYILGKKFLIKKGK